jgi:hypothetical protein
MGSAAVAQIDFARAAVALFGFGLATLSGLLPLLAKEHGKNLFSFLTCLCGAFCLVLSFPSNQSSNILLDGFIPVGCALMAVCQIILKNIPRLNQGDRALSPAEMEEDCEEGEIELMIPRSSTQALHIQAPPDRAARSTLTSVEVAFLCSSNLVALFVMAFGHGVSYSSREHVGYGKLIATILFVCLMTMTQGVLVLRTELQSDKYLLYVLTLSCGYPLGIISETLFSAYETLFASTLFMGSILSLVSLSHGVLLYIALMALAGSEVRARGKSQMKIGGIVVGTIVTTSLLYVNLYL